MALFKDKLLAERAHKLIGLSGQLPCRLSHLLGSGGILLNDSLQLLKRLVDLFSAGISFLVYRCVLPE